MRASTIAFLVFVIALIIRLLGIQWGLPSQSNHWSRHPDEPVIWAYSQQIKPAEGKFTPGFYNYGTLYLTMLRVATDVVNGYGGSADPKDPDAGWKAMARYHLAGRVLSALSGAGMAAVLVLLLLKRTNIIGAIFGGLLIAFSPGLVIHSQFQTVDMVATFMLLLSVFFAFQVFEKPDLATKPALLSGLFCGLSAGTKYIGVVCILVLLVFCVHKKLWKELAFGMVTALVGFVVATPGFLIENQKFMQDLAYEMSHTSTGHGLVFAGTSPAPIYQLANLFIGVGTILSIAGFSGLVLSIKNKQFWGIALSIFFVGYFMLIGRAEVKFLRYSFPLIPPLAIGFGYLIGECHAASDRRYRAIVGIGIFGLSGVFGGGISTTIASINAMNPARDPRVKLAEFMNQEVGSEAKVIGLVQDPWFYSLDLFPEAGAPRWIPFKDRQLALEQAKVGKSSRLIRYIPENPNERQDWEIKLLDQHPDYVVFSSFETEGLSRLINFKNVPEAYRVQTENFKAFTSRLNEDYDLLYEGSPNSFQMVHDLMYISPNYWIWRRKSNSSTH